MEKIDEIQTMKRMFKTIVMDNGDDIWYLDRDGYQYGYPLEIEDAEEWIGSLKAKYKKYLVSVATVEVLETIKTFINK